MHATRRSRAKGVRDAAASTRAKDVLRRVRRPLRAACAAAAQLQEQRSSTGPSGQIEREIRGDSSPRGRPLVVGPWLSEVGFETLYWVPFLHWVKAAFRLDPDRLVAVSRGGVAGWYRGLAVALRRDLGRHGSRPSSRAATPSAA